MPALLDPDDPYPYCVLHYSLHGYFDRVESVPRIGATEEVPNCYPQAIREAAFRRTKVNVMLHFGPLYS